MPLSRRRWLASAAAAAGTWPCLTLAQSADARWPAKPVRLIVPNVAGGGVDILTRLLQGELQKVWTPPVLVDYKPGAGTVLGTDYVAKSPPDGYTIGMVVTSHVINPGLRASMPFDTLKDLAGVGMTATSSILLSASPKLPVSSLQELIAYAKAPGTKLSYATPGAGSAMHLGGELLKQRAGFDMLHVPYKGSGGAYADVSEDRVNLLIDPLFSSLPHVKSGRLKPLAVLSARRDPIAPQIGAAGEILADFDVKSINGMVVPRATPRDVVQKISRDVATALRSEELRARLSAIGLEPVGSSPEQFDDYVAAEMKRWDAVVKAGNITLEG